MAQKVQVVLVDDVDGGTADETVTFALDGVSYEIDLTKKNAARLRDELSPWVGAARKVTGPRGRRAGGRRSGRGGSEPAAIRSWAKGQGIAVSERGRISAELLAQYEAAH
jgi:Lsr2